MAQFQQSRFGGATKRKAAGGSFTGRCSTLVKEQRARIYILRRCATALLCFYIQGDD